MEFDQVIRKQRMTRRFANKKISRDLLDSILASAQKAPTAGYSQGVAMVVLEGNDTDVFWKFADPQARHPRDSRAPVIVIPLASKKAYLDRYSEPDKADTGMHVEERWPVPYWLIDCAFASMTILLAATAAGLGCWFFGIGTGEKELLAELNVPAEFEPIGVIALGYPAKKDVRSPSLKRGRKPFAEFVHRGEW
jgi:nitroreductase